VRASGDMGINRAKSPFAPSGSKPQVATLGTVLDGELCADWA